MAATSQRGIKGPALMPRAPGGMHRAQALALRLLPTLILGTLLLAAWPGYLSFDSAGQFQQARAWQFSDVAPPIFPALWGALLRLGLPDSSGMLLVTGGLHAFGFSALALQALRDGQRTLAWLLGVAGPLCPLLVLLIPHLWTDLLLSGCLTAALGLLARSPRWRSLSSVAILSLLFIATAARHNAVLATAPLVFCWACCGFAEQARTRRVLIGACAVAAMLGGKTGLNILLATQPRDTWAVSLLYDLQAVSVATQQQRIPASLVGPAMDVAQLQAAFNPYSCTSLFSGTTSGVANPTVALLTDEQRRDLLQAWAQLPGERSWWQHRSRLFRGLLGSHRAEGLKGLADSPSLAQFADNPTLVRRFPSAHDQYRWLIETGRNSWLYAPGLYLALGLIAAALSRGFASTRSNAVPIVALTTSICAYTLPYFVLAPSAETRYLLWPALAGWLLLLIAIAPRRALRQPDPG